MLELFNSENVQKIVSSMEKYVLEQYRIGEINIGYELEFYFELQPSDSILEEISTIPFILEIKKEIGVNQYEIVTSVFNSFCIGGNAVINIRNAIQTIAKKHNNLAIFDAVYQHNEPPSSLQVSISFIKHGNIIPVNNIIFQQILQNLIGNISSVIYLLLPTENCYERITNHNFAKKYKNSPTHITWGTENRTVAIRIAKIPNSSSCRMEYRLPSPIVDPHLISLAMLSSMLCESPKVYLQTFVDSLESNAEILPQSQKNALQKFMNSLAFKTIEEFQEI